MKRYFIALILSTTINNKIICQDTTPKQANNEDRKYTKRQLYALKRHMNDATENCTKEIIEILRQHNLLSPKNNLTQEPANESNAESKK